MTSLAETSVVAGGEDSLGSLLASFPTDMASDTAALAAALADVVGGDVTVALHDEAGWVIAAGPDDLADGTPVVEMLAVPWPSPGRRGIDVEASSSVAIVVQHGGVLSTRSRLLMRQALVWLGLAGERGAALDRAGGSTAETFVLRAVIEQLLTVRDLDQVLLSIVDRSLRLLDADICGVLLREGDELRMRSCVGHRVVETSRLRMTRGQGVAGLVFLTGEPAKVDDYLRDRTISQDFVTLAEQEQTRSALAVPLRLHGEFLGVLEVWRRRPSLFTSQDVARMVTLADVATIAIDNARRYDEQASVMVELREVRDALEAQVTVLRRSAALQRTLLGEVAEGAGLAAIARTVATETGCQVGIYGSDGRTIARHAGQSLANELPDAVRPAHRSGCSPIGLTDGSEGMAWVEPVFAEGDRVGCVCLLPGGETGERPELLDVVTGQVAMACSLALLRQRAASRARSEALEQVLWDLLQGPVEHQVAARSRARQMGVLLSGSLRVLYGQLENVDELAAEHGWDTSRSDRVRRDVLRSMRDDERRPGLLLSAMRGDWVVGLARDLDRDDVKELVKRLNDDAREVNPGIRLTWGISRTGVSESELPRALDEAKTALSAAHRLGGEGVFLYEELGIVRLLLGSGKDPDLKTFIHDVTGPLLEYDRESDGSLVRTLRAYFDADCSQKVAAERLFIHHKTLRYRLERIQQLTGLDLRRHDDRVRADVALRLLQVGGSDEVLGG
jgi:sugar diacid utilization regulator/putative methionine-R-sulfoxide reductase with GAF domain